jgi:hypothetical protein
MARLALILVKRDRGARAHGELAHEWGLGRPSAN